MQLYNNLDFRTFTHEYYPAISPLKDKLMVKMKVCEYYKIPCGYTLIIIKWMWLSLHGSRSPPFQNPIYEALLLRGEARET